MTVTVFDLLAAIRDEMTGTGGGERCWTSTNAMPLSVDMAA